MPPKPLCAADCLYKGKPQSWVLAAVGARLEFELFGKTKWSSAQDRAQLWSALPEYCRKQEGSYVHACSPLQGWQERLSREAGRELGCDSQDNARG